MKETNPLQTTESEAEALLDKVAKERFQRACIEHGVSHYGVTGIDLSKPGEIAKVTSAILSSVNSTDPK